MKRIILLIILIGFLNSCYYQEDNHNPLRDVVIGEMNDYVCKECDKIENFFDITDIMKYMIANINYMNEIGNDYWQLPEETFNKKGGDCEDIAILFLYFCKNFLNIDDCFLVRIENYKGLHIVPQINEDYYEPIGGYRILLNDNRIIWRCNYEEAIWMSYNYHDSVGQYY